MNTEVQRPNLFRRLEAVIDPASAVYQETLKRLGGPNAADTSLMHHELGQHVVDTLRAEPEFQRHPHMRVQATLSHSADFSALTVAPRLVRLATERGVGVAIQWLNRILAQDTVRGSFVALLWGIEPNGRIPLTTTIELLPVAEIPASAAKDSALGQHMAAFHDPISGMAKPRAALIKKYELPLWQPDGATTANTEKWQSIQTEIEDTRLCLTAAGPCAPVPSLYWFQPDDPDVLLAMQGMGFELPTPEIAPTRYAQQSSFDEVEAPCLVQSFLRLEEVPRKKVRRALDRLNRAMRRQDAGDRALELGIALDLLLMGDRGEHNWKVGYRAALLASGSPFERMQFREVIEAIYTLRSGLVHSGAIDPDVKVKGYGKLPSQDVVERGSKICAAVIRSVIRRGDIPDWRRFEMLQN